MLLTPSPFLRSLPFTPKTWALVWHSRSIILAAGRQQNFPSQRRKFESTPEVGEQGSQPQTQREFGNSSGSFKEMEGKARVPKVLTLRNTTSRAGRSISYMQIVGTGMDTGDTSPSVLLFFDNRRFLFNAGEGLQRFCVEHKIKLSKIDHIFLTRVCSVTAGGLPGTLLTLAGDIGQAVNIWGPSDLQYLVDAMSTFLPNASVFHTHSFGKGLSQSHKDDGAHEGNSREVVLEEEMVKISAALLMPEGNDNRQSEKDAQENDGKRAKRLCTGMESYVAANEVEGFKGGDISVVYVCELPEVKGKFDPAKAAALGLRRGQKYGRLQDGHSVKSDDEKRTIYPSDVMEPSSPGPILVLVDCPTQSHIPSLLASDNFSDFYNGSKNVTCLVHISPACVVNDSRYRDWMLKFGAAQHILAGHGCSNNSSPVLKSSARILTRLNYICPHVFPISALQLENVLSELEKQPLEQDKDIAVQVTSAGTYTVQAENMLKFRLRPLASLGLDKLSIPEKFSIKKIIEDMVDEVPDVISAAEQIKELWISGHTSDPLHVKTENLPQCLKGASREEMEIVFLGTGSSQPSKYRNVSAIYVHLFHHGGMLLDCGEGTYAQLKRRFGELEADDVVSRLRCVWISHIHADHHAGLARILSARKILLEKQNKLEPILVIGPKLLKRFLEAYARLEELSYEFLDCSQTTFEADNMYAEEAQRNISQQDSGECLASASESLFVDEVKSDISSRFLIGDRTNDNSYMKGQMRNYWTLPGFHIRAGVDGLGREKLNSALLAMGLKSLHSVPVIHCPHAFAVVIESEGKTTSGSELLGWKLAYSGDTRPCKEFVEASKNATVFIHEATFDDGMSEEALAKKHSLTSEAVEAGNAAGAYRTILTHFSQRYPKIPVFDDSYDDKTCIAFDMMSVNLADLPMLPKLLPALKILFRDEVTGDEGVDEE